ncbi:MULTISPECIES: hypothetical protein [unclassified Streptomyces]|uniref:hypothetical protein n=1 Tax=unclassified Streptomyces TaxID=2593676 RepID=UPI0022548B35|nr:MULTISPECIES: hypothetical protein [unclassified Streptomyces]MCX5054041.1 hypothetical protein [Streptomyces sp. NBC_00474]MCX5063710.1 hypothetical protein [Streptomyces sp. NBC_00452]MCX5251865.1 hypothetical protein [Streptomyces sp. NBC_00201]MCX5294232.1 hypothetical protein [Streptomyces sp. NBC_00183]
MPITMQNYALTWTDRDGVPRSSAVAYDKPSAGSRQQDLEAAGCSDVLIVETKPGQLPDPAV